MTLSPQHPSWVRADASKDGCGAAHSRISCVESLCAAAVEQGWRPVAMVYRCQPPAWPPHMGLRLQHCKAVGLCCRTCLTCPALSWAL